ncbi:MAG: glycosyltransferase family 39 protein [Pirellulales bacterium]
MTRDDPPRPTENDSSATALATVSASERSRRIIWLVGIVLLGTTLRAGLIVNTPGALATDPDGYRRLAEQLRFTGTLGHGDVPSAFRPPLYPLVLVPLVGWGPTAPAAIAVLHLAMAALTIVLVVAWGETLRLGRASYFAALVVACDPVLLWQSTQVMTETLAALLAAAAGWLLARASMCGGRRSWLVAGAVFGLGALCRPDFLVWSALVVVALLLSEWRRKRSIAAALLVATAAAVVLMPWVVRNWYVFGRPLPATTHGGYTALLANNPEYYESLRSGRWREVWIPGEFAAAQARLVPLRTPADELARDRENYRAAGEAIHAEPGMFAFAALVRIEHLWGLVPHRLDGGETTARWLGRMAVGVWYLALYLLAVVGWQRARGREVNGEEPSAADRGRRQAWRLGWLVIVALTLVHLVYFANMRMRAPAVPVIALTAAAALTDKKR